MHPAAKEKPGRRPFKDIKMMKDDPAAVEKRAEEIKARTRSIFKVLIARSTEDRCDPMTSHGRRTTRDARPAGSICPGRS